MTSETSHTSPSRTARKLGGIISKDKHAFQPHDTLRRAGNQMRSLQAGRWPVVQDRRLVGMIDGPNPDWRAQRFGHDPEQSFVSTAMSRDVSHGYDDEDCAQALAFMLANHLRYMPVTDHEGHFVGIVSLDELLAAVVGPDAGAG